MKKKRFLATMSEDLVRSLPRNFVREFLCQILDKNDKIDWKSCSRDEDKSEFLKKRIGKLFEEESVPE